MVSLSPHTLLPERMFSCHITLILLLMIFSQRFIWLDERNCFSGALSRKKGEKDLFELRLTKNKGNCNKVSRAWVLDSDIRDLSFSGQYFQLFWQEELVVLYSLRKISNMSRLKTIFKKSFQNIVRQNLTLKGMVEASFLVNATKGRPEDADTRGSQQPPKLPHREVQS